MEEVFGERFDRLSHGRRIYNGQEFKDYPTMCEYLGIEIKVGKSKIIQLEELSKYFKLIKIFRKLRVVEVYQDYFISEIEKNVLSISNKTFVGMVQLIIFGILGDIYLTTGSSKMLLSKKQLLTRLWMVNPEYTGSKDYKVTLNALKPFVTVEEVVEFYSITDKKMESILDRAFRSLCSRNIISKIDVKAVKRIGFTAITEATDDERGVILNSERQAMSQLNFTKIRDVVHFGKWDEYVEISNRLVKEILPYVENYYNAYSIIISDDMLRLGKDKIAKIIPVNSDEMKLLLNVSLASSHNINYQRRWEISQQILEEIKDTQSLTPRMPRDRNEIRRLGLRSIAGYVENGKRLVHHTIIRKGER